MKRYPVFLNLTDWLCVVFGGGAVAERKVVSLLEGGAHVVLVSPKATRALTRSARQGVIEWRRREGTAEDLESDAKGRRPRLAFISTNSPGAQRRLAAACRRRGIPANVADSPEESDFILPSIVERGPLQVAVSTSGESPSLAQAIRQELEDVIDPAYKALTRLAGVIRRADLAAGRPPAERRRRLDLLLDGRVLDAIRKDGEAAGRAMARKILGSF